MQSKCWGMQAPQTRYQIQDVLANSTALGKRPKLANSTALGKRPKTSKHWPTAQHWVSQPHYLNLLQLDYQSVVQICTAHMAARCAQKKTKKGAALMRAPQHINRARYLTKASYDKPSLRIPSDAASLGIDFRQLSRSGIVNASMNSEPISAH